MANKRSFNLSTEQADALHAAFLGCKHGPTRTRLQAVRLYGTHYPLADVLHITGCKRSTLLEWCRKYRHHGVEALFDHRAGGNSRKLSTEQLGQVQDLLDRYQPCQLWADVRYEHWRTDLLKRLLAERFEVVYQDDVSYHQVFKRCGYSYQRPARRYKSRSEEKVLEFEQQLEKKTAGSGPRRP